MTIRHTPYSRLSPNQLHNTLLKKKTPLNLMEEIKERVRLRKEVVNKQRVEDKIRAKRWNDMIKPLSNHIKTVRSNLAYHEDTNTDLYFFYLDYLEVLLDTRNTLTKRKLDRTKTPINTDKNKRDWTDWVDKDDKARLTSHYNALPKSNKANRRTIFPKPKQGEAK